MRAAAPAPSGPLAGALARPDAAPLTALLRAPLLRTGEAALAAPLALPSIARIARTARLDAPGAEQVDGAPFAQRLPAAEAGAAGPPDSTAGQLPFVQAAGAMQDSETAAFIEKQAALSPALQRTLGDELRGRPPAAQASARMDLLRPAAGTVQREPSTVAASASEGAVAKTSEPARAEASAQEIERLAREVYSRLRQRLMVDAERLGR